MSQTQYEISEVLEQLGEIAPAGYALGFHIAMTTPKFMFQSYPKAWLDYYSQNGLVMSDPMVAWGFEHTGTSRWSELNDPAGVLQKAGEFGMPYGIVCATKSGQSLSICGFARADREFLDTEITDIFAKIEDLHRCTAVRAQLSPETIQELRNMSILFTHPGS
jgi:LuxR family transcriptional regulator